MHIQQSYMRNLTTKSTQRKVRVNDFNVLYTHFLNQF